ncbi:MAG: ABC transporter permease [Armatimonadota bacterium]|nr:ABC transporter permease [Armatimonadota bacterium]
MLQEQSSPTTGVGHALGWMIRRGVSLRASSEVTYRTVRLLSVLSGLLLWEWAGRNTAWSFALPPASSVLGALAQRLLDPEFWLGAFTTAQAFVFGLALIVATGIPAGLVIGRSATARRLTDPHLAFLLAVPAAPLVPLFMIVFGAGLAARVATVFLFGIAVLVVNTAAGVRLAPRPLVRMAESFGATRTQVFRRVVLPAAVPGVMAGLRLAAGRAVVGTVVSELIIISVGLGKMINQYSASFDAPNLFAVMTVVLAAGLAVARAMNWAERKVVRWR